MRFLVLGAAGGVGMNVVHAAARQPHEVTAVSRQAHRGEEGVRWVSADVRDTAALIPLLDGADAVLWCVGVTKDSGDDVGRRSLPPLIAAMVDHGVRRFVGVSGAGTDLPGDRKGRGARFVSAALHRLSPALVEDKEGEHAALVGSSLDWTQVRPPRMTNGAGTGKYRLTMDAPGLRAAAVAKADVALAMVHLAEGLAWRAAAPFLVVD